MPRALPAEISMRHFPDLSDTSFKIPPVQDDLLTAHEASAELAYDAFEDGELGGLDGDPFTTPLPKSKHHAPLTLSEITPRGEMKEQSAAGRAAGSNSNTGTAMQHEESSVRRVLPKTESVDDMFARRKRDNYQQMGIDLTSKSTARLRRRADEIVEATETHARPSGSTKPLGAAKPPSKSHVVRKPVTAKTKRPILGEDARISKKPRAPPLSAAQQTKPKSILKPPKAAPTLPPSTLARTIMTLSQTPKSERPKWGDVVAEVQYDSRDRESRSSGIGIMGGGLIDVLVMYGEKLKGSLGFSSSGNTPSILSNDAPVPRTGHSPHVAPNPGVDPGNHPYDMAGPSSKPLTLSDLTPSKSHDRRRNDPLTLSELSPSRQRLALPENNQTSGVDEEGLPGASPMRPSTKRASTRSPRGERKKGKTNLKPSERPESPKVVRDHAQPGMKTASKPRTLGPSHAANNVPKNTKPLQTKAHPSYESDVAALPKSRPATVPSSDPKGKRVAVPRTKPHSKRGNNIEQHAPLRSLPPGPVFASDVYRHRALEKAQSEREKREQQEKHKRSFRAGAMPYFNKPAPPARPAVRKTVPAAFVFQSDARAAQRNAEFEEKRKTWESRTTHHALPMPDFVALHAAQAETTRARRAVPVLPTAAPALTTMTRAKEREKFEEERRAREQATERLREIRERERAEQEERAYKEARKRTVPKAHEVPEWYKDLPKRKEVE